MNLKQLDLAIRSLSESEIGYKNGTKKGIWPQEVLDGREIPCLNLEEAMESKAFQQENTTFHVVLPELNLSIKRNARFNPVPTHTHDYIEISYMYSGECPEVINGKEITLLEGEVLFLDTKTPHSVGILKENDIMINLLMSKEYLHGSLLNHLSTDSIVSGFFVNSLTKGNDRDSYLIFHSQGNRRISMFFNELLCECCDPSINSTDIITNLIGLVVAELINVYEADLTKKQMMGNQMSVIPIIHYIEANYKTCTRESVAGFFHIHEKYLTKLLKNQTGMTYKQLIQSQKLKYAAKLLRNSRLSITDVITESGYENANFFYRKFREEYGVNPKEFRERHLLYS